jgi:hypothetical protein
MRRPFAVLLLAALLAGVALHAWRPAVPVDFEQAQAFGAATTSVFARVDGVLIHCRDQRDAQQCIDGSRRRGRPGAALWFGNSQLHAINQYRSGERTAASQLHARLALQGLDLTVYSQPSASFQEQLLLFDHLLTRLPVRLLILPAVYDDTREDGVRDTLEGFLDDPPTRALLQESSIGRRLVQRRVPPAIDAQDDTAGVTGSLQAVLEQGIDGWLERHSSLWAARPTLRGELFNRLYITRNTLLGIHSTTQRHRIAGRYDANMQALAAMLQQARARGVRALLYIAPIRSDVPMPYDAREYDAFKRDVQQLAEREGAQFADLEALVPASLWGLKAAGIAGVGATEVDFMHFQAAAHELLAERLYELLRSPSADAGAGESARGATP